jgi:hypothetical protein
MSEKLNAPQPPPKPRNSRPIWELVIEDMQSRDAVGRERYGTPLQAHNGRDSLVDAYQEALDLSVYLRQAIEEKAAGMPSLDAILSVVVAACAHLAAAGPCSNLDDVHDPEYDGPYCDVEGCTYCALARACDALPEEMKP